MNSPESESMSQAEQLSPRQQAHLERGANRVARLVAEPGHDDFWALTFWSDIALRQAPLEQVGKALFERSREAGAEIQIYREFMWGESNNRYRPLRVHVIERDGDAILPELRDDEVINNWRIQVIYPLQDQEGRV